MLRPLPPELLTAAEVKRADTLAEKSGISFNTLMENAGRAVADCVHARYAKRPVLVLCGPGNNGGDGKVAARLLCEWGWEVEEISIDAFKPEMLERAELCIDAMFGVGLARPLTGAAAEAVAALAARGIPVVAVDIPSGIAADTGEVLGCAVKAVVTVTFFRAKPGLFLLPGKAHCGEVVVADIGIPERVLDDIKPQHFVNQPALWKLPELHMDAHKYTRGYALVAGGGAPGSGAAKLAALAALRVGAGMVAVACPPEAAVAYAASLLSVMVKVEDFSVLAADKRVSALLVGPGNGVNDATRAHVRVALASDKPCVLDADALTVCAELKPAFHDKVVLTPHEGEFARLFSTQGDKLSHAAAAAKQAGCTVVLKGSDTIIAGADGRVVINANAPPWLATAGAGDVLAGMICGLMAQGMAPFDAACAGVWLHGQAGQLLGRGLIAEDLPGVIATVWPKR